MNGNNDKSVMMLTINIMINLQIQSNHVSSLHSNNEDDDNRREDVSDDNDVIDDDNDDDINYDYEFY